MRFHCLQHVPHEGLGYIENWIIDNQYSLTYTNFFEDHYTFPNLSEFDALIILGGYMNIYEEQKFPFLKAEKDFIKDVIASGKKILGICLGAQLLSDAIGGKVIKNNEGEIGFFDIHFNNTVKKHTIFNVFENIEKVFHWHNDTFVFDSPLDIIASSIACENQAFIINNQIVGFQFHIEMNEEMILKLIHESPEDLLQKGNYIMSKEAIIDSFRDLKNTSKKLNLFLNQFFIHE